jgi:hypothetical protein
MVRSAASYRRSSVRRHIIGGQHEAVVHIAGADDVLVDLVGFKIPARRPETTQLAATLHRGAAEQALAAG